MDELDNFINQFYTKYTPNDIPQGDRRVRLKEKLSSDFDGYVTQMYTKYSPDSIPDQTRLASLKGKYLKPTPQPEQVEQPVTQEPPSFWDGIKSAVKIQSPLVSAGVSLAEGAAKSIYSGLTDQTPKAIAQSVEAGKSAINPANINEYISNKKPRDFQRYVRDRDPEFQGFWSFATPFEEAKYLEKYGKQFMEDEGLASEIPRMEKDLPKVIERRKDLEAYVQQQNKEAAEKTQGVVQDYRNINSLNDLTSYIGSLGGQAASQIPLSVATKGLSSYVMESAAVYDKQLDRLAEENKISREQVIERNLDKPAAGQLYAVLAAGLDNVSAGNLISSFRKGGGSLLKKAVNTLGEGVTETGQGVAEDLGAGYSTEQAIVDHAPERLNELLGGVVGGGVFSFKGAAKEKQIIDNAINEVADTGDAALNATIDAEAALTPEQEEVLKTKIATEKLDEVAQEEEKLIKEEEKEIESVKSEAVEEGQVDQTEVKREAAIAKLKELTESFADPAKTPEESQEIYKQLAEAKQALFQIAPTAKPSTKKSEVKTRIEDTTGVTKPEKSVKMTPAEAIKQQVQTFYKGMEEGVRKGQKMTNEQLVSKVQSAIKDSPLQPKQINSILGRVKKTNLFTPGSISRLNDYIDKVSGDAEYADKISEAQSINKRLRRLARSASGSNTQNYKSIAKAFASINPEDSFINPHLKLGREILSGLSNTSTTKYSPFNVEEAKEYIDDLQEKIGQKEETFKEPSGEARNLQTFTSLRSSVDALKQKDLTEFDDSEKRIIETLRGLDTTKLTNEEASSLVKVIDNIVENDDFSNAGTVEPIVKSRKVIDELKKDIEGLKLKEIKGVGKLAANLPQQFSRVTGDSKIASLIQQKIGVTDLASAGSRVENQEIGLTRDLKDKLKEVKKKYKEDVISPENQTKLVIFSELARNYGDDSHIPKVKNNIERTIREYTKADPEEGKIWADSYEPFKNVNTVAEAEQVIKKYPALQEIWSFFNKRFGSDINQRLAKVTNEVHNKSYIEANNYTTSGYKNISNYSDELNDIGKPQSRRVSNNVKPKQSKTSIMATRNLQPGTGYSSDWIGTQLRGYRESLYDIEASRPGALLSQVLKNPEFKDVVGGEDNANIIRDMIRTASKIQAGMSRSTSNDAVKFLNEATSFLRNIGSARALGSSSQFLKQVPSVWVKSMFNHLGSGTLPEFFKAVKAVNLAGPSENLKKLFNQYTIGVRGERLGGIERGDSISYRLTPGATQTGAKMAEYLHRKSDQFTKASLKVLTNSDTYAARTTWLSYYLQNLKEQGVTDVNLNEEYLKQEDPKRKQAAAFAEQLIAETQVPSNPAFMSQLTRNESDTGYNFAKNILLPFSTYSLNSKYRQISNLDKFIRTPNRLTSAAVAGDMAEVLAFAGVAMALSAYYKPLIKQAVEALTGVEPPEEDKEKSAKNRQKAFNSSIVNSLVPISVGTIGESATSHLANQIARIAENPEMSYEEWKKETGGFVYEPDKMDLGLFALGAEPATEALKGTKDIINSQLGEPVTFEDFGHTKEVNLSEPQQNLLIMKTLLDYSGFLGLSEADVYNQVRKAYKEQLRSEPSVPAQSSPRRKRIRRRAR